MANQLREPGFYGTTTETAESHTVFVDTSLDTHLAIPVVESDTVSDFKKKIALEHMHCFPKIEDLQIHSMKVKRKGSIYHLPESVLVWSAFFNAKGDWYLSVDASSSSANIPNSYLFGKNKTQYRRKRRRRQVRADQSGAVPFKVPDISAGLVDAAVKIQDNDTSTGRKKKKSKKPANNVVSERSEPAEENHLSSGNGHADVPVVEKAKDSETTDNTLKNAKEELSAADVQEDLPVTDQTNDIEIHEASSQVPDCQSEEKHEKAVETDDLARAAEGINFRDYFVPSEVKNANHSSMELTSMKKVKTNGLPSVSTSTEVQSSSKLSGDHKSHVRKDSSERWGDSAHNSDSSRRSSRVLENVVKDSSASGRLETNIPKPKEKIVESSVLKKKNASVVKSSLWKFPGKSENWMELKTPKKKSVLKKPGTLFQDVSGDENGTTHSSGITRSPSKSDHTESESDSSLDSTRNGSTSANGQSTAGKGRTKLDILFESGEEITMEKVLRSSMRFEKAKLIAMQNAANEAVQNES